MTTRDTSGGSGGPSGPVSAGAAGATSTRTSPSERPARVSSEAREGLRYLFVWMLSVALHVTLLLFMYAIDFRFFSKTTDADVPVARITITGPIDPPPAPTTMPSESTLLQRTEVQPVRVTPEREERITEGVGLKKSDLSIMGIGGGGGDFDSLGLTAGGDAGPTFFGVGATARGARSAVFVIDSSASMTETFHVVIREIEETLSKMRRSQKFHVIVFAGDAPIENPPRKLVNAIGAQKRDVLKFLRNIVPRGGTRPLSALQRAFALEPDVIYLLSDGEVDEREAGSVLPTLDRLNEDRRVKIFTIAFLNAAGTRLLRQIALEHGGEFTHITEADLP